ncbi:MAG: P-II family nitrogen regulator [Clostridia bacterium]|nr:P-II family nitrogen regulator [Clostridia bacterium]
MNLVISIINPNGVSTLSDILQKLKLPLMLTLMGHGTATKGMLELLGMDSKERRVVLTAADTEKTRELIQAQRRRLYIDAPGNGILLAVPIKSAGGGKTMEMLSEGQVVKQPPVFNPDYELVLAIANEGCNEQVMDAAREAGARGGTVLHAKGTGAKKAAKFFKVSIAQEKEIVLIVAASDKKSDIMKAILEKAGPGTEAGAIAFSLPVSEVVGFATMNVEKDTD